jgi:hypothetical protein
MGRVPKRDQFGRPTGLGPIDEAEDVGQSTDKHVAIASLTPVVVDRRGTVSFCQSRALRVSNQGKVETFWWTGGGIEKHSKIKLPWHRSQKVVASDDAGDALFEVVDYNRKLIGKKTVSALQHEVTDLPVDVFLNGAEQPIVMTDDPIRWFSPQSQTGRLLGMTKRSRATDSGIASRVSVGGGGGLGDVLAAASARVEPTHRLKVRKRVFIAKGALALVDDLAVPLKTKPLQISKAGLGEWLPASTRVDVLYPQ